jgi:hypothetical protein
LGRLIGKEGKNMSSIDEIARRRSLPGILILNQKYEPIYLSGEARHLLNVINGTMDLPEDDHPLIPNEIYMLCSSVTYTRHTKEEGNPCHAAGIFRGKKQYLIRTAPLFTTNRGKNAKPPDIMVFIESPSPSASLPSRTI